MYIVMYGLESSSEKKSFASKKAQSRFLANSVCLKIEFAKSSEHQTARFYDPLNQAACRTASWYQHSFRFCQFPHLNI